MSTLCVPSGDEGLKLAVADIGDEAIPFFVQANPVRQSAQIAPESRFPVLVDSGAAASSIGRVNRTVIRGHDPLGSDKPGSEGLHFGKIDFHLDLRFFQIAASRPNKPVDKIHFEIRKKSPQRRS